MASISVAFLVVTFVPSVFNCAIVVLLALHISMALSKDKLGSLSSLALVLSHIMQTIQSLIKVSRKFSNSQFLPLF